VIAGYVWPQSAPAGARLALHVSTSARRFAALVVRQGAGEERLWSAEDVPGTEHPLPGDAAAGGCRWPVALEIPSEAGWPPGFYLVRLRAGPETAEAFFVLRPRRPGATSPRLLVLSTSTWAAYHDWGGPSYYTGGTRSSLQRPLPKGFLERPEPERFRYARMGELPPAELAAYLGRGYSFWSGAAGWAQWERAFVAFAERSGLPLELATSADLETEPELLAPYRSYLSVGHDEYWSAGMRDAVEAFVGRGGNAAFFSGNVAYWRIRFEDGHSAQTCFKMRPEADPVFGSRPEEVTTMWSDPLLRRPENGLTGVSFTRGGYAHLENAAPRGSGGYTVWRPDHWAFAGCDLRYGDALGAGAIVVGYECDGCELTVADGLPVATGADGTPASFEVLATAPAHLWAGDERPAALPPDTGDLEWVALRLAGTDTPETRRRFAHGYAVLGSFVRGGCVFTTGCTDWTFGLAARDPLVERVTRNVLERFSR
jgi:hypothetical protein